MNDEMDGTVAVETESWAGTISQKDSQEVAKFSLIPKGSYPGVLVNVKARKVTTERGDHPLEGKTVADLDFLLNGETRDYHLFVTAYPEVIKATSKSGGTYMRSESEIATKLYDALQMHGESFSVLLDKARETTLKFIISISEPKDLQYKPQNKAKIFAYKG